jgi:hypothetical protein
MRRNVWVVVIVAAGACGCTRSRTLETGYTIRPLGATPTEIRGYYAERFTPEARAAALERDQELEKRRYMPGN